MTITFVSGDTAIEVVEPIQGQMILINNAGGHHQNPGSYGYTETLIREIEVDGARARIKTDAFGWGCWSVNKLVKIRSGASK